MATWKKGTEDAYLRCRTYGHAWDEFSPIDLEAPQYGWRLSLRCIRCTTERHDSIAYGTGQVQGRSYIYPEGYQYAKEDMPNREEFREELFTKLRAQLRSAHALGEDEKTAKITPIRKTAKKVQGGRARKAG